MIKRRARYVIHEVEITQPRQPLRLGKRDAGAAVLVRRHGTPVAFWLAPRRKARRWVAAAFLDEAIARHAGEALLARAIEDELQLDCDDRGEAPPSLTIAVCTHGRPDRLTRLLDSFARLEVPDGQDVEVLVVDNAPTDDANQRHVERLAAAGKPHPSIALRYTREPKTGLDFARNHALREARGQWLAFVDDDVVMEPTWLVELRRGWRCHPDAAAITGLVLPLELQTRSQVAFERSGGFGKGFDEVRYHGLTHPSNVLYPCNAGAYGVGANMAFDTRVLRRLGGFDDALDTGRPLPGGGDLDIFLRVVDAGEPLVYWPRMVVRHEHRRDRRALRRQYESWGRSLMALAEKNLRHNPRLRGRMRRLQVWYVLHKLRKVLRSCLGFGPLPADMVLAEFVGALVGMAGEYRRSQRRVDTIRRSIEGAQAPAPPVDVAPPASRDAPARRFRPWSVRHVQLDRPFAPLTIAEPHEGCFVVFWRGDTPLGQCWVRRRSGPIPSAWLAAAGAAICAAAVGNRLWPQGFTEPLPAPWFLTDREPPAVPLDDLLATARPLERFDRSEAKSHATSPLHGPGDVSVVVCTRHRPDDLERCLSSLQRLDPAPREILVVDNGSDDPATRRVVERHVGVRYAAQTKPGLAAARNTGVHETSGAVIAYTDDDAEAHRGWIAAICRAFDSPTVGLVTGLVSPAALDTPAQVWFEGGEGSNKWSYRRRRYNKTYFRRMRAWGAQVWTIGAGANMALTRDACRLVGLNDERLGPPHQGCGEDSEHWYRFLAEGFDCVYEPRAVVHHDHRRDNAALDRQMRSYIQGHIAALWVQLRYHAHAGDLLGIVARMPKYLLDIALFSALYNPDPPQRVRAQATGYVLGLLEVRVLGKPATGRRHEPDDASRAMETRSGEGSSVETHDTPEVIASEGSARATG